MQTDYSGGPYGPTHPNGQTSGTPERPMHRVANPLFSFDIAAELTALRAEPLGQQGGQNAKTLVKEPTLRIVLIALQQGGRVAEHQAPGRISIQVVAGRIRLHVLDQNVELQIGQVLVIDANLAHDVEALDESAFLLTIAWPEGHIAS